MVTDHYKALAPGMAVTMALVKNETFNSPKDLRDFTPTVCFCIIWHKQQCIRWQMGQNLWNAYKRFRDPPRLRANVSSQDVDSDFGNDSAGEMDDSSWWYDVGPLIARKNVIGVVTSAIQIRKRCKFHVRGEGYDCNWICGFLHLSLCVAPYAAPCKNIHVQLVVESLIWL